MMSVGRLLGVALRWCGEGLQGSSNGSVGKRRLRLGRLRFVLAEVWVTHCVVVMLIGRTH